MSTREHLRMLLRSYRCEVDGRPAYAVDNDKLLADLEELVAVQGLLP